MARKKSAEVKTPVPAEVVEVCLQYGVIPYYVFPGTMVGQVLAKEKKRQTVVLEKFFFLGTVPVVLRLAPYRGRRPWYFILQSTGSDYRRVA